MNNNEAETYSVQIWRTEDNRILKKEWRNSEGKLDAPDIPAIETWDKDTGIKTTEQFYKNGIKHRDNDAAVSQWDKTTGKLVSEAWFKNGILHRDGDFPAITKIDPLTSLIIEVEFFKDGDRHRESGPASIIRYENGQMDRAWIINGDTHRSGGKPAIIKTNAKEEIIHQEWWEKNVELKPDHRSLFHKPANPKPEF